MIYPLFAPLSSSSNLLKILSKKVKLHFGDVTEEKIQRKNFIILNIILLFELKTKNVGLVILSFAKN